jgi:hypothetical protein
MQARFVCFIHNLTLYKAVCQKEIYLFFVVVVFGRKAGSGIYTDAQPFLAVAYFQMCCYVMTI